MERKLGEVFTCNGENYQVVKGFSCNDCAFIKNGSCYSVSELLGPCAYTQRSDKTNVVFKEIKDMEIKNNQLTIDIPEGMEIDLENSDLAKGIVKFKQSDITYEKVAEALNLEKNCSGIVAHEDNISKLGALNRLMNIAKYYNEGWKPDWVSSGQLKYYIYYSHENDKYQIGATTSSNYGSIWFRLRKHIQAVIDNPNFRDILNKIYKN